jgi:3-hydroxy-9,10-secoandrosta-1,3,5(10)-triene-9,17-dione monooxygenase reductase component
MSAAEGPAHPPIDPLRFREWMSRWPTGVTVVTARHAGLDAGLTVNAFLSVSIRPPTVLVALSRDVDTLPVLEASGAFAVNLLSSDQRPLSERFARSIPPAEKFAGLPLHRGPTGSPLLDGTLGALDCRVVARTPAVDHLLVVGEVAHLEFGPDASPLVFYHSGYAEAEPEGRLRLPLHRR